MRETWKGIRRYSLATLLVVFGMTGQAHGDELKIATIAPDGSHWMREMRAGAQRVNELTDGRVEIKFYPGGVMGTDGQVLRKIRIGQLQGGAFAAGGLGDVYSGLNLYGIPLLFESLDEVDHVRERLDPKLAAGLEAKGFVSLGFSEGGFAHIMANQPIRTVEDMRRKKVWIPEGDQISFLAMEALGLSPVSLPVTDVLTGLQTGLLEVVFNTPVAALVLQWHTKVRYRTALPVTYSMGVFALEARAFGRLSADDQAALRRVMGDVMAGIDRTARRDNVDAARVIGESGVQPVPVDASQISDWRRTIETIYPELRRRPDIDSELLDELLGLLADYRAGSAPAGLQ